VVAREVEEVAIGLFAELGFEAATAQRIAAAANISERTFYRYFPSKADVLRARPRRQVELLCAGIAARPAEEPLLDAVDHAVADLGEVFFKDEEREQLLWVRAILSMPPREGASVSAEWGNMQVLLAGVIEQRLGSGADTELKAQVAAGALLGAFQIGYGRWTFGGARSDLAREVRQAVRALKDMGNL
jgi:TetR/AcrR family transcriptional regulator, regulator of mycofactocin system